MQHLFLGIDGGGSTCKARIVDSSGASLGEGRAGPANTRLGVTRAFAQIETATRQAMRTAGLADDRLSELHAGAGLAGLNLGVDRRAVASHPHPFATLTVETDVYVACLGAFQGRDGAVLVFGTGSCGCAIIDGNAVSVGGWGFQVGDHASGASVGREALRLALLVHDGVLPASALGERVLARFDGKPETLVTWADTAKPMDYGKFAPLVVELAQGGDHLAIALLNAAGEDASALARALLRRGASRVALAGGFAAALRPWLAQDVRETLVEPLGDGMDGAVLLARRALTDASNLE
jgi:glucosamine kinase